MIKIIALDLDGTLLDSGKHLSPENRKALEWATAQGIEIVPTTGRFYDGIPEVVRQLPFIHYAITINGAQVYDLQKDVVVYRAELPTAQAVALMTYMDRHPVIYDSYIGNWGWMTADMQARVDQYFDDPHFIRMVRTLRTGVPELKEYVLQRQETVQKVQFFTSDTPLRLRMMEEINGQFPNVSVTSAASFNVEVNADTANKGQALLQLADYLGVDRSQTMAMGDGLNDLSMVVDSGIGVAMENAIPQLKEAADFITVSNDQHGVAEAIYRFCK